MVRGIWVYALNLPRLPVDWAESWGPLPVFFRCGVCGCGGLAPTLHRTLLRAGVARRIWRGLSLGAVRAFVRGVSGSALILPRPPALPAGGWGPLPTGCGCGGLGLGTPHWPLGLHALPDIACLGAGGRLPGGGGSSRHGEGHLG